MTPFPLTTLRTGPSTEENNPELDELAKDERVQALIQAAVVRAQKEVITACLFGGLPVNCHRIGITMLMELAYTNQTGAMEILIGRGADVNARNQKGCRPLMYAAQKGHVKAMEILIKANADFNAENQEKMTALMIAAKGGHLGAVQLLLKEQADIFKRNNEDQTALNLAVEAQHFDVAECIVTHINQRPPKPVLEEPEQPVKKARLEEKE